MTHLLPLLAALAAQSQDTPLPAEHTLALHHIARVTVLNAYRTPTTPTPAVDITL